MRVLEVGSDIDLAGPGSNTGSSIDLTEKTLPFRAGSTVLVVMVASSWAEAEQDDVILSLEGREESGDSWTTQVQMDKSEQPLKIEALELPRYIRWANDSESAADGRGSIHLIGN